MAGVSLFLPECPHFSIYFTLDGYGQYEGHPLAPLSPLTSSGAGIILFEVFVVSLRKQELVRECSEGKSRCGTQPQALRVETRSFLLLRAPASRRDRSAPLKWG